MRNIVWFRMWLLPPLSVAAVLVSAMLTKLGLLWPEIALLGALCAVSLAIERPAPPIKNS